MMGSKATPAPAYLDKDDQLDALELGESDAFVQPAAAVAVAAAPIAAEADAALRRGFVRKVYGILTAQLALTACVAAPMAASRAMRAAVVHSPLMYYAAVFGSLGLLLALFATVYRSHFAGVPTALPSFFRGAGYVTAVVCVAGALLLKDARHGDIEACAISISPALR